jgi:hypothetical protein
VWSSGGGGDIYRVNTFFSIPQLVVFFIKPKTYQPPLLKGKKYKYSELIYYIHVCRA